MNEFEVADWIRSATGIDPWWPTVEPTPRWVRVRLGDTTIADSRRALLLIVYGPPPMLPTYFFPIEDIAPEALIDPIERPDGSTVWTVQAGGREVLEGAWTHPRSHGPLAAIEEMATFTWRGDLEWLEEDEPVFVHARDPHKRVDVAPSSRRVEVRVDDVVVAASDRPLLLFETTLPTRYYLPRQDVRMDLLEPSDTVTRCPYKGIAHYWSLDLGGASHPDIAWSYPDPIAENPRIRDLVCFFNERVDLTIEGVAQPRPTTPFSPGAP